MVPPVKTQSTDTLVFVRLDFLECNVKPTSTSALLRPVKTEQLVRIKLVGTVVRVPLVFQALPAEQILMNVPLSHVLTVPHVSTTSGVMLALVLPVGSDYDVKRIPMNVHLSRAETPEHVLTH